MNQSAVSSSGAPQRDVSRTNTERMNILQCLVLLETIPLIAESLEPDSYRVTDNEPRTPNHEPTNPKLS